MDLLGLSPTAAYVLAAMLAGDPTGPARVAGLLLLCAHALSARRAAHE